MPRSLSWARTMPKSSSTLQLKARLAELRDQFKNQMGPSLKDRMTELNKASRKKATLIEFAEKQEVPILQSDTIARIYAKVEAKFNQEVPGTSLDKVGFGKFADKDLWPDLCGESQLHQVGHSDCGREPGGCSLAPSSPCHLECDSADPHRICARSPCRLLLQSGGITFRALGSYPTIFQKIPPTVHSRQ